LAVVCGFGVPPAPSASDSGEELFELSEFIAAGKDAEMSGGSNSRKNEIIIINIINITTTLQEYFIFISVNAST
jgi:hypothetical protein